VRLGMVIINNHSVISYCSYCMIGLYFLMAGDDSRMAEGQSGMARGESRTAGDCCRPEGSIHRCVHALSHLHSHIYMALWPS
jgi:hypothetical protein